MRIAVAQIEIIPGNPSANAEKMIEYIDRANKLCEKPDLIIFPENSVPGYMLGDKWEQSSFLADCKRAMDKVVASVGDIHVAFGTVLSQPVIEGNHIACGEDGRPLKVNVCVLARNGKIIDDTAAIKTLMPNYRGFDDSRHFYDGRKLLLEKIKDEYICGPQKADFKEKVTKLLDSQFKTFDILGYRVGFLICEDSWDEEYTFKPFDILARHCDIVINLSCSPYTFGKNNRRHAVFSKKCKKFNTPMVYVNCVGCQNIGKTVFVFDGNSCAYDRQGNVKTIVEPCYKDFMNYFRECLHIFEVDTKDDGELFHTNDYVPEDIGTLFSAIRYGTKQFMKQNGIKKIAIGASGGMDSCLAAIIYASILPPQDLYLVNMPYKYNSQTTIGIAEELAKRIGCNYVSLPIAGIVDPLIALVDSKAALSGLNRENVQARARLQMLSTYASAVGAVFTCNSNKSETTVGYCTFYGDLAGWLANIADLWKTQVYEMAAWFNKTWFDWIPQGAFDVKPSAELSADQNVDEGKGDPMNYPYHDKLFATFIEKWSRATPHDLEAAYENNTVDKFIGFEGVKNLFPTKQLFMDDVNRWWKLHSGLAVAKRVQAPPILCVSRRSYGFDLRESIGVNHE